MEALQSKKSWSASTATKATQLVMGFLREKMVTLPRAEISDRFQRLRNRFWGTEETVFKPCEWLRLFLIAVLAEHTDIENAATSRIGILFVRVQVLHLSASAM